MNRKDALDLMARIEPLTMKYAKGAILAGSFRRGHDTVGDLDLVVLDGDIPALVEAMKVTFDRVTVVRCGEKIATVKIGTRRTQVEFYRTNLESLGATLLYATGSGTFNQAMRALAKRKGLKLNQYGLWSGRKCLASRGEEQIFNELGLRYIPPEQRDGTPTNPTSEDHQISGNVKIAKVLQQIANAYAQRRDIFRARAFATAAKTIRYYPKSICRSKEKFSAPGIGEGIKSEILTIIETGRSPRLESLR